MHKYVLAADGGGTKCSLSLYDKQGSLIETTTKGPANIYTNFVGACEQILSGANELAKRCQIDLSDCILSAACAGAGMPSAVEQFEHWQHPFAEAWLLSDVHAACLAAREGSSCSVFILGTGSCFATLTDRQLQIFGGHGSTLGDVAGGAWLGKRLVSWYLLQIDGIYQDEVLECALRDRLSEDKMLPTASYLIEKYSHASPECFAKLAPCVFELANNSPVAKRIINEACSYIQNMIGVNGKPDHPIFLVGGLSQAYLSQLEGNIPRNIALGTYKPDYGAFLYAKLRGGNSLAK